MKKRLFSLGLILLLIFLAYQRRPDLTTHQLRIIDRALLISHQQNPRPETGSLPPLRFHDFWLFTTTSDPQSGVMVSFGFGHYIKIVNDSWGRQAISSVSR